MAKRAKTSLVSANMKPSRIMSLEGEVFSGSGEGAKFIKLPWVRQQIIEKIGFTPYLGTLNVKLTQKSLIAKNSLKKAEGVEISPPKGFCRGKCFNAYLNHLKCALVVPEVEGYPEKVIEIIAPVSLREKFKLKDGDIVKVKIMLK